MRNIGFIDRAYNLADVFTKTEHNALLKPVMENSYLQHLLQQYFLDTNIPLFELPSSQTTDVAHVIGSEKRSTSVMNISSLILSEFDYCTIMSIVSRI